MKRVKLNKVINLISLIKLIKLNKLIKLVQLISGGISTNLNACSHRELTMMSP